MRPRMRWMLLPLGVGFLTLLMVALGWAQEYSHARIVRLSFAEGNVTVSRPDVSTWAEAPVNTPLQEGFKLSTGENSFAEVEFENGTTIRLGQLSLLEFTQLALAPSGAKLNRFNLSQGYATFHALLEGEDVYEVAAPQGNLTPRGKALFRVDVDQGIERIEVFKGSVDVSSSLGSWALAKNDVLELQPASDQPSNLAQGITKDEWDKWVDEREERGTELARRGPGLNAYTNNATDLMYGWNDLSMYGLWSYMPGYGYGWVPDVSFGWSPYTIGRWCWYPGFGYTWISGEPWGWLPYHYGSWAFINGVGWGWFPQTFGAWSPAVVNWYSGPGWIGWAPQKRLPGGGTATTCAASGSCGAVVSVDTFRSGGVVVPGATLPLNPLQGRLIDRPDIPPDREMMLPGPAVPQAAAVAVAPRVPQAEPGMTVRRTYNNGPGSVATRAPAVSGTPSNAPASNTVMRRGAPGPPYGIAFDPVQGRYVNSNAVPPARPTSPEREQVMPGEAGGPSRPGVRGISPAAAGSMAGTVLDQTSPTAAPRAPTAPLGVGAPEPLRDATSPSSRDNNAPSAPRPSTGTPQQARPAEAPSQHRGWWGSLWHSSPSPDSGSHGTSSGSSGSGSSHSSGSIEGGGRWSGGDHGGGAHSSGSRGGGESVGGGVHGVGGSGGGGGHIGGGSGGPHGGGSNSGGPRH